MIEAGGSRNAQTPPDEATGVDLNDPRVLAWFDTHVQQLRQDAYGQRLLYASLAAGFVVGLLAHLAGYVLRPSATTEPIGLLADLLYAMGFALWTGVVVVVFVQVIPEVKRGQIKRALKAHETIRRDQSRQRHGGKGTT